MDTATIDVQNLGPRGEEAALRALKKAGYRILERNYRCPLGEVDLIARDGNSLVFVEVKSGLIHGFPPRQRVDRRKKSKLSQLAHFFMREKGLEGVSARFDVVEVNFEDPSQEPKVAIIPNAFELED